MKIISSYHPAVLALESLFDQFPAALNFRCFCNDNGIALYSCDGKNMDDFTPKNIINQELKIKIQKFRDLKKEVFWGDDDDLPVRKESHTRTIKQLSIQDEIEQNILIFRVPSLNDDSNDVFSITFSKSFSNFYIPSGRNALSSEMKVALGKTIRNQVLWTYKLHKKQSNSIRRIQQAYLKHADEVDELHVKLEQERDNNRALLDRYLLQLLRSKEIELDANIRIKKGFLDKIINADIGINEIKSAVETAVATAHDLAVDKSNINLSANLIDVKRTDQTKHKSSQLIALDKTHALLDRYEQAARQLNDNSVKINGRNLAKTLEISGPAITDAIKKHQLKIAKLIEKHPDSWPLICEFIRPLQEIRYKVALSS
ncbi:hypothetical protein [Crocinitomix algicola]|uniref:hypothetical protein n=1 Tax=Crocinitomix algicola TaxID=1740263 RepID=UPI0008722A8D|nr:hypothetical protein [Crocinitomix algicola]